MLRFGELDDQGHGTLGDGRTLADWWSTARAPRASDAPATPAKTPAPEPAEYLSIKALASYSGISTRTLRTLLKDPTNPIPFRRIGRKLLIRRGEYDSWADQFRGPGAGDVGGETSRMADEILGGLTRSARRADTRAHITERG